MASDTPALRLSDIMFPLDPALLPLPDTDNPPPKSRSPTPEPLEEQDMLNMRNKALEIREAASMGKGKAKENTREQELVDMVLRLTSALPSRSQIMDQAATISRLSLQQDFLIQRMDEERERWAAERDGMHRVSEALMVQASSVSHNAPKEQENSKRPAAFESENASLRQKLLDAHNRMASFESELAQLRPLLLMHPRAIALAQGLTVQPGKPRGKGEEARSYYRVREEKTQIIPKNRKKKPVAYFKHSPTVADARSEHLLLAARKLGRERASVVSQPMYRTVDPPTPVTLPNDTIAGKGKDEARLSLALWPQQPRAPGAPKNQQQSPPRPPYGSPTMPYPPPAQQYLVSASSVGRPGAPMPAHTFYHHIPGPAWPYYTPGHYAFGQPIAIPGGPLNPRAVRPANVPPMAGPSRAQTQSAPLAPPVGPREASAVPAKTAPSSSKQPSEATQQAHKTPQLKPASANGPPTPMDSLLSAAHSVFSPDASGSGRADPAGTQGPRRARTAEDAGSPTPVKRRRLERGRERAATDEIDKVVADAAAAGLGRRVSALEVLADQAVVVGPSSSRSRSGSVSSANAASPRPITPPPPSSSRPKIIRKPRKRKQPAGAAEGASAPSAPSATAQSFYRSRPSLVPTSLPRTRQPQPSVKTGSAGAVRKGKAARTSTRVATRKVPVMPAALQRSASEEKSSSVSTRLSTSPTQMSSASFRLRPVQADAFARADAVQPEPSRSSSVPHRPARQNGRASVAAAAAATPPMTRVPHPLAIAPVPRPAPASTSGPALTSVAAIDDGDEPESEDEDEEDQLQDEDDGPAEQGSVQTSAATEMDDVNSRRWKQILGRKDA